jgi:nitrogenase molybdenum-iron protein NifN
VAKEDKSYRNVSENPCNMCMPLGGIIAFKGIEGAMTLLHGSQGCATYMRRTISEHYDEPIDVASSSLNEKGTVFGGEANLKKGLENVCLMYQPQIIGVLTTCLAETIGEDIGRITAKFEQEKQRGIPIISVPTPGYGGSHSEGYWLATQRIVAGLAEKTLKHARINLIIPHISAADIRELKRLLELMQVEVTLFPDYSDTLDAPYNDPYLKIPAGGTRVEDIVKMPGAPATIELGITAEDAQSPGKYLETEFGVPLYRLPLPVGIESTDLFFATLSSITGKSLHGEISKERGRLLDGMFDAHKHSFLGKAVIFGEPEQVFAATKLCLENGITPKIMATGSRNRKINQLLTEEIQKQEYFDQEYVILNDTDFSKIMDQCRILEVNLAIGHSEGKVLSERLGLSLVRYGFPILDRMGSQRLLSLGYQGSLIFLDRLTNTLLENKHKDYRRRMFEKYYPLSPADRQQVMKVR